MKRLRLISLSSVFLLSAGWLICSCSPKSTAENPNPRLNVDKVNVEVIITGKESTGTDATVKVTANLGYEMTSDVDWITPDKLTGRGVTIVTLAIKENDENKIRQGRLTIKSRGLTETVTVTQNLDPDTDDGYNAGHVYLSEPFDFIATENLGGDDQVAAPWNGATTPLRNSQKAMDIFEERGYWDYNWGGNCFYMAEHYLKMGKTNNQTGLTIKLQQIDPGKSTSIELTFDAAPVVATTGTGEAAVITGIDATTVVVEIMEGPGHVNDKSGVKVSDPMDMATVNSWGQWVPMKVKLNGVTAQTTIAIRSGQQNMSENSARYRWYLDNIKMVKAEN